MSDLSLYRRWARMFEVDHPSLSYMLSIMPWLDIPHRKALVTFGRVQPPQLEGSYYYDQCARELEHLLFLPASSTSVGTDFHYIRLATLVDQLISAGTDPIIGGILVLAAVSAPYVDYSSSQFTKEQTIIKEINAAESHSSVSFNYSQWLADSESRPRGHATVWDHIPLNDTIPSDSLTSRIIHRSFLLCRDALERLMIYPRVGRKTVGREARDRGSRDILLWNQSKLFPALF
jgi:hypothetical protein